MIDTSALQTIDGPWTLKPEALFSYFAVVSRQNVEIFHVDPQGRVIHDNVDVTDDDAKMAMLLCEWIQSQCGITINRSPR